ncbi:uncharacterized protein LOC114333175 isoform X2 [Diabrotica virgifera virgifera]|uniref:Uncharacterized protein n=1 Tax=Diabrotica virgifera virgifera TaxID=50390 RepID=A0ABM5K815_DIAVI|nr:uncharacterized protein LOC114333175 isoform X2 [Diabrotica virgifera virgifera]
MQQISKPEETELNDLSFKKRLENVKYNLEKRIQLPYTTEAKNKETDSFSCNKTFKSHPRICSSSNTYVSVSPRFNRSYIDFDIESLERNKERIKNARRLHEKLSYKYPSQDQLFDIHIGDSYDVTPVTSFSNILNMNAMSVRNDPNFTSEIKELYMPKRKGSVPTPEIKYSKTIRREDKGASKFVTQPLHKILPESVFEKKFRCFVEKSLQSLNEIRNLLDKGIEPPDGDEDISRRKLRVKEFSNRFSRNYLYPIVRQIDELSKFKQIHPTTNQKVLNAYNVIYNGLVAYQNHLPTSIGACSSDKLKLLLKHLMDLCDIHFKLVPKEDENGYCDIIQNFKQNAEVTLQKVEDMFTKYKEIISIPPSTPQFHPERKPNRIIKKNKNNLEDRLYMYNTSSKTVEAFSKKRLNTKSRYKTSQFKHRPLLEKVRIGDPVPLVNSMSNNCKILTKKLAGNIKKSTLPSPINEDSISTMIQMVNVDVRDDLELDAEKKDETKTEIVNHEEIVVKLLQLVLEMKERRKDDCDENVQRSNDEKETKILEKIKEGCDYEVLKEILNELQENKTKQCHGELELKIQKSADSFTTKSSRLRKESTLTTDHVKIKKGTINSDSSVESDEEELKDGQTEKIMEVAPIHSGNKSDSDKENKERVQKISLNMKRSSKSSKYLKMLSKDYALDIIQYKIDFYKHCKTNPMYSTTNIRPWILMNNR